MMNLHNEAESIAKEAWLESGHDEDTARDYIHQSCDGHEIAIYYHKAVAFCAEQRTDEGEQWLDDCGGIAQQGDSFSQIACRIAFATLLCACESALSDIIAEHEETLE
jgi:hypothetical protein